MHGLRHVVHLNRSALPGGKLTKVLKQHRIIKGIAAGTLRDRLRAPAVELVAPDTVQAATTHVGLLVERLALLDRQLHDADRQLD